MIMEHKNIVSCLLKRQQRTLQANERRVLYRFAEDQTAFRSKKIVKCQLPGNPRSTFLVAFSPDGKRLASTHGDHTVKIVDLKTGCCLESLKGHPRTPWSVSFHPSKHNVLASGCLGGEVRVWDLTRGDCVVYRQLHSTGISSLAFHPTDLVLLIATDNELLFWNWEQPTPFASIETPSKRQKLRLVKFDPLGQHILTGIRNTPEDSSGSDNSGHSSSGVSLTRNTIEVETSSGTLEAGNQALHHYQRSGAIIEPSSRFSTAVRGATSEVTEFFNVLLATSLQARIDYVIADTLAEQGNVAMASNMTSTTCRLQLWDFTKLEMPKLQEPNSNVIVPRCKLYNDASTDISADGRLLGAFVPSVENMIERTICVFSLESYNLGQCLFSKQFGPNAISVSFSPFSQYLLVGLASSRILFRVPLTYHPVAQIYKFSNVSETMEHVSSLKCPVSRLFHSVSTNAAFWNPVVGSGVVYVTNKGEVYLCHTDLESNSI